MDTVRIGRTAIPGFWTLETLVVVADGITTWQIIGDIDGTYEDALQSFYHHNFMNSIRKKISRIKAKYTHALNEHLAETLDKIGDLFDIKRNPDENNLDYRERLQKEVWKPK